MSAQPIPRTAAATAASKTAAAVRAVARPDKRARAVRIVGAGLATGHVTPEDLAEAIRQAQRAPAPDVDTVKQLRALLAPTTPGGGA